LGEGAVSSDLSRYSHAYIARATLTSQPTNIRLAVKSGPGRRADVVRAQMPCREFACTRYETPATGVASAARSWPHRTTCAARNSLPPSSAVPPQPIDDPPCYVVGALPLRKMPGAVDQPALVRAGKVRFLPFAHLRQVHGVERAVQRERGHALLRHGIEAGFELGIPGIAVRVAPARAIGVQRN